MFDIHICPRLGHISFWDFIDIICKAIGCPNMTGITLLHSFSSTGSKWQRWQDLSCGYYIFSPLSFCEKDNRFSTLAFFSCVIVYVCDLLVQPWRSSSLVHITWVGGCSVVNVGYSVCTTSLPFLFLWGGLHCGCLQHSTMCKFSHSGLALWANMAICSTDCGFLFLKTIQ